MKKITTLGFLGTTLDFAGHKADRWSVWRPTVSLCSQEDLIIHELHLLHPSSKISLAQQVVEDIHSVSPETQIQTSPLDFKDPWDFEEVYSKLFDFFRAFYFKTEKRDYLLHITTGTHVAQICMFLLTESRHFPGRLIQTSPGPRGKRRAQGHHQIIDLDLAKYDHIASRFRQEHLEGESFLKSGIETKNRAFNAMIEQIEKVAIRSKAPMLLTGPTGAGKSQLAERIFQLKQKRKMVQGNFVPVNCATLRGENAMASLFGHTKGAFTGAHQARDGFLLRAHLGVLFLDEIGELGLDEQAMLLHALETQSFYPVGSDQVLKSQFQLIAGTNRDLKQAVAQGRFREDLLARINLWTYDLPGLKDRREDIEPNVDYELKRFSERENRKIDFNKEAR